MLGFFCKLKMHFYGLERTILLFFGFFFPLVHNVMENYLNYLFSICFPLFTSYIFNTSIDDYFYYPLLLWFICILCVSCTWNRLDESQVLRSLFYFEACQERYIMSLSFASWWCYQVQVCSVKIALMSQLL